MSDFSNLSKKEQEAIMRMRNKKAEKNTKEPANAVPEIPCAFVAAGKGKEKCTELSSTPYGFCKKHIRTVQAKKAKEVFDSKQTEIIPAENVEEKANVEHTTEVPHTKKSVVVPSKEKALQKTKEAVSAKEKRISKSQPEPTEKSVVKNTKKNDVKDTKKDVPKKDNRSTTNATSTGGERKAVVRTKKIGPNSWGRYEDPDTHIVFNKNTKEAYGIQEPSGKISALKPEHVKLCVKHGWNYVLPYGSSDEEDSSSSVHDSDFDESEEEDEEESELESSSTEDGSDEEDVFEEGDEVTEEGDDTEGESTDKSDDDSDDEDDSDSDLVDSEESDDSSNSSDS